MQIESLRTVRSDSSACRAHGGARTGTTILAGVVLALLSVGCGAWVKPDDRLSRGSHLHGARFERYEPRIARTTFPALALHPQSSAQEEPLEPGTFGTTEDIDRWLEKERADNDDTRTRVTASGFWLPAVKIRPDKDESESNDGLEITADLASDPGFGVHLALSGQGKKGLSRRGIGSIGVLYLNSRHTERDIGTHAHVHQVVIEAHGTRACLDGPIQPTLGLGFGIGGVVLDFDEGFDDTGGITGTLRGEVGLRVLNHLELTAGAIGFLWGYPGEWVGYGGSFLLGGSLHF